MGGSDTTTIRKAPFPFFWKSRKYNPRNVKKYLGWMFETYSNSFYGVTEDESFYGPPLEGAKIDLIGGIKPEIIKSFGFSEDNKRISKEEWDRLIMKHAEEIREGLQVVVSFTREYEIKRGDPEMYTSVIRKIHRGGRDKKRDN
jgi:hypothetical protein